MQYFDNVIVKQNGYLQAKQSHSWVSWGLSYEFPIEIEGSRHFTVKPKKRQGMDGVPGPGHRRGRHHIDGFALYEGVGELFNDETGTLVGISVNESADTRVMKNGPFHVNQK